MKIEEIIGKYFDISSLVTIEAIKEGKVNDTYKIITLCGEYYFQKINKTVFCLPEKLMNNIEYLTNVDNLDLFPKLKYTKINNAYVVHGEEFWRVFNYAGEKLIKANIQMTDFYELGKRVGELHNFFRGIQNSKIVDTIKDYHSARRRIYELKLAISNDKYSRYEEVEELVKQLLKRMVLGMEINQLVDTGLLKKCIVHNDLTINNIVWNGKIGRYVFIDLDTTMEGTILYDVGELIRNAAIVIDENKQSRFDVNICNSILEGYLIYAESFLKDNERKLFAHAIWTMNYLLCMRYLTDYLNGDIYFKTDYKEHNHVRSKEKFELLLDIETNWNRII